MISVVVVDDSAFMRKAISTMLEKDPEIKVTGIARDGMEGLDLIRKLNPDVVTLDIEMPRMDGLTALTHIMREMPRPVLMISSLTTEGAESTLKALELGAVDFIPKQLSTVSLDIVKIEDDLRAKVKLIAKRRLRGAFSPQRASLSSAASVSAAALAAPPVVSRPAGGALTRDAVAIGVSTGGPPAVQKVLSRLPADFPVGIVIAQHMPAAFTGPFAKRLDGLCAVSVKEAEDGDRVLPGTVFVAPGGKHVRLDHRPGRITLQVTEEPREALYKPSVNVLMTSLAQSIGRRGLGVILTGMGNDGMEGVKLLKEKGGRSLAQSDTTCVVYGMPKAIVDAGLADEICDIDDMAGGIMASLYK